MGSILPPSDTATEPRPQQLFQEIEKKLSGTRLCEDRWYIMVVAVLAGGPDPELAGQLYLYLISQPKYSEPSARQTLVRRLREALVKSISIVGVCKPIESIVAISKLEREEDKDFSFSRENWQYGQANHERGVGWMQSLYQQNYDFTLGLFDAHKDFSWISTEITYGLYLSDRTVLDDLETQMVVLPGIMIQNLKSESHWHIRGTRRIGVSREDVTAIWDCVQIMAKFLGTKLDKVPTVDEVEADV
ncbi:hypothetical protein ACLOAV_009183 [Pseudogymnoascus australis]